MKNVSHFFDSCFFNNQSSVHVTVAGTVGHWWFEPAEANSFCSSAVNSAFIRTVTTSFGSICFGSMIVALLETLRMLARAARDNDDGNAILLCLAECILSCLASIMEYFNKVRGCSFGGRGCVDPLLIVLSHNLFVILFTVGLYLRWSLRIPIHSSRKECIYTLPKPWLGSHYRGRSRGQYTLSHFDCRGRSHGMCRSHLGRILGSL